MKAVKWSCCSSSYNLQVTEMKVETYVSRQYCNHKMVLIVLQHEAVLCLNSAEIYNLMMQAAE